MLFTIRDEAGSIINHVQAPAKKGMHRVNWDLRLNGLQTKNEVGEKQFPIPGERLSVAKKGLSTNYGPTQMHREILQLARNELNVIKEDLDYIISETLPGLKKALREAGAPIIQ